MEKNMNININIDDFYIDFCKKLYGEITFNKIANSNLEDTISSLGIVLDELDDFLHILKQQKEVK